MNTAACSFSKLPQGLRPGQVLHANTPEGAHTRTQCHADGLVFLKRVLAMTGEPAVDADFRDIYLNDNTAGEVAYHDGRVNLLLFQDFLSRERPMCLLYREVRSREDWRGMGDHVVDLDTLSTGAGLPRFLSHLRALRGGRGRVSPGTGSAPGMQVVHPLPWPAGRVTNPSRQVVRD